MRIDIHIPWLARKITALKISTPTVTQLASPSGGAGSGTKVTLSDAARHTASAADAPVGHVRFPRFFVCQRVDFMLPVFPDVAC